jgi:apolipoprotein N-acyltransferase
VTSYLLRSGIFLESLTRWRRLAAAFAAGAISALGFAPVDAFALFLLGMTVLVILLDGANASAHPKRNAAFTGWAFGFGQFVVGMHWIFYPFLVDPVAHAWQIPFVALLFPGGLALFPMQNFRTRDVLCRRGVAARTYPDGSAVESAGL